MPIFQTEGVSQRVEQFYTDIGEEAVEELYSCPHPSSSTNHKVK